MLGTLSYYPLLNGKRMSKEQNREIETVKFTEKLDKCNETDPVSRCSNCQSALSGPFCAECGQESGSTIKYFWSVIMHLLDDVFSFDSRASRTLWPLVFRPGYLTNEYILGRRVHYVPPLRLYLFISIVFFISLRFFAMGDKNDIIQFNPTDKVEARLNQHLSKLQLEQKQQQVATLASPDDVEQLTPVALELQKFLKYQEDINNNDNKIIKGIAAELLNLEFSQIDSAQPLSKKLQRRHDILTKQLNKARNGDEIGLLSIGNQENGDLAFDVLSAEENLKLNKYIKSLERKAEQAFKSDSGPLVEQVISKLPQLMFVLLPLFAALLKIMYLFSKRYYIEHLTVALHSHSFIFVSIFIIELIDVVQKQISESYSTIDSGLNLFSIGLVFWMPIYLFIMQKRVYKQGYLLTAIKYMLVGVVYTALISMAGIIAVIWGLTDI